ncbi:hypothetical protein AGMMS49983_07100 [Clostridia bacterium]|nr:hypothetical protein AGMMS49983_07100 [Clostridia bacterium]
MNNNWTSSYAAVRGADHLKRDVPCQDKTHALTFNEIYVIALADGAGSANLSHYGAEAITQTLSNFVAENLGDLLASDNEKAIRQLATQIRDCNDSLTKELNCKVKDLSSTLLLVAVKNLDYFALHIGDGVIGYLHDEESLVLSNPENGEYENMTWFTTADNLEDVIRIYRGKTEGIEGFILMSDGTETSLFDKRKGIFASAVKKLIDANAKTESDSMKLMLKESLEDTIAKRTNDDCSIALLSKTDIDIPVDNRSEPDKSINKDGTDEPTPKLIDKLKSWFRRGV